MNIVIFSHPNFLGHQSMPRFTNMLFEGMLDRGHDVQVWAPKPVCFTLTKIKFLQKWLGYIDQFVLFPIEVKKKLSRSDKDTLFVFSDNALGPWVPLIKGKPHVMHCHDFLAQNSALGKIPQNITGFTGKLYQKMIRNGFRQCHNFISVSKNTKQELDTYLNNPPKISEVVYNGFNRTFLNNTNISLLRTELTEHFKYDLNKGYILHVGGNQWYKNRLGILEIYESWRKLYNNNLPLLLVGEYPDETLVSKKKVSLYSENILFLSDVADSYVNKLYSGASVFLFPSLAEGFGWPIAEAMASGSLVITINEAPMNEVAADAGFYIGLKPKESKQLKAWSEASAKVLDHTLNLSESQHKEAVDKGLDNAKRFNQGQALDTIEAIYIKILKNSLK